MCRTTLLVAICFCVFSTLKAQNSDFIDYIERYKKIAVEEMERAGVPASIKLAQALLESNAGKSELAKKANNHFGIKCHSDWTGKTYEKEDDDYDQFGNLTKSCFRKYKHAEESYIAHSEFLRDPRKENRYGFLFRLDPTDYKRWAKGLRTSGYATGAGYDDKLIRIIETYNLSELDRASIDQYVGGKPDKPTDAIPGLDIRKVNDVKVVFAKNKITVQDISALTRIPLKRLEKYNDVLPPPFDTLQENQRVYLQPKRCRYRGDRKWHYVEEGQTMLEISQLYAVNLKRLYKRNRMPEGSQPQKNERLKLKGFKIKKGTRPRLATESKPTNTVPPLIQADDDFMDDDITPEEPYTPGSDPTTTPPDVKPTPPANATYHTVVKGDTLYSISRRYGITVDEVSRLNGLASTVISIGQVLRVK
ncbi:MAG: glucosaminidase domain-containing protein [Lewinellaceae bacterium]|nr:glucosaminidase domain-containing protein [Saprospiraceae bacterium]MCB9339698.1 glucosaminidase domain-containing protein [Lewinellaceae bacterium]